MSFGNFIRTKRLEKGYTLRGFSVKVGISPTFTSRMERDEIEPPRGLVEEHPKVSFYF